MIEKTKNKKRTGRRKRGSESEKGMIDLKADRRMEHAKKSNAIQKNVYDGDNSDHKLALNQSQSYANAMSITFGNPLASAASLKMRFSEFDGGLGGRNGLMLMEQY